MSDAKSEQPLRYEGQVVDRIKYRSAQGEHGNNTSVTLYGRKGDVIDRLSSDGRSAGGEQLRAALGRDLEEAVSKTGTGEIERPMISPPVPSIRRESASVVEPRHPSRYNGLPVASVHFEKSASPDPAQAFRATLTFRDADGRDIGRVGDLGPAQVGAAIGSVNATRLSRAKASGSLERDTLTEFHGMGPSVEHARTDGPGRGGSVEPRATGRDARSADVPLDPVRRARHDREAEVLARFDRVGRELRFRDGRRETVVSSLDDDRRLSTPSDDPRAAHAVAEIAVARGWSAVSLKGSDAFKREAWIEARARGLETRGYRPNESDREALRTRSAELGTAYREQEETRRTLLDRAIDRIARSHTRTDSAAARVADRLREGLQTRADEGRVPKGDPEQAIRRAPEHDRTPVRQPEPEIYR